jgi:rfaE bifunctional protein kinase chain/domain
LRNEQTALRERLAEITGRFPKRRILVVGDAVADQFIYGAIGRVSREAPVFILRHEHTETVPGGAANCAVNLASLGAQVSLVSIAGDDEAGRALQKQLAAGGVDCSGLLLSSSCQTTTKVRILAGQLHSTRQQVIRIDYDGTPLSDPGLHECLREKIRDRVQNTDAVIVSDYNYGVAAPETISFTRAAAVARRIPIMADSRYQLANFAGFTAASPNQDEVEELLAAQFEQPAALAQACEALRARMGYSALLVTRGSHGLMLLEADAAPLQLEAVGAHEPVDVTGAGDTVMAAFTLAVASGSSFSDAARLANYAGGLVVMKRGTASVTREELEHSVLHAD